MVQIVKLNGVDRRLYKLVAPLVMNPKILKANNNYPFKTTAEFVWFVAVDGKKVVGFVPMEQRGKVVIINNYYVEEDQEDVLFLLLTDSVAAFAGEKPLEAVVQVKHQETFEKQGFVVEKVWKQYVKMRRDE